MPSPLAPSAIAFERSGGSGGQLRADAAAAGLGGGGWSAGGWLGAASGAGEGGEEDSWHNCVFWVARAPPEP